MIIQLPNGETAEFPDNMSTGEIESVLQKQFPKDSPQESLSIPQQIGRGLIEQLPVAGMVLGGAGGSVAGPLGAVTGAGLGGGIGAAAKGYLQETLGIRPPQLPMQNIQDIGKEAALGATAEVAGPYFAKGIQKVISPFAGSVESRMAADPAIKAAQTLVEQGSSISPDVIAGTKTSRFFNWMAEKMWPASSIINRQRGTLQDTANQLMDEFTQNRNLYQTSKGGVNQAWENWVNMAGGPEAPYELPKTLETINKAMDQPFAQMGAFWKKHAATFQQELNNNGQVTVQSIRDLLNTLNPTAAKGAERTARMKIADSLMADLGTSGNEEMVTALQNAREMARLQRIAGPLQAIFNKSMTEPLAAGEEVAFSPSRFVNLWNQRRGNFLNNKNYSAEDVRVIDTFADKMKALVPDLARANKVSPPTLSIQGALTNPLTVWAAMYKFPAIAVPVGLDAMLANSLMSPNGIMRKFLTIGFTPPTLSTKMGLMKGLQEATND